MGQTLGQREAFRHARETRLSSGSRHCGVQRQTAAIGKAPQSLSEESSAVRSTGGSDYTLDSSGRDAETMRRARGIGTALIAGFCVWAIVLVVGYFLWVYRP